jgi:sodium transport system permease protein
MVLQIAAIATPPLLMAILLTSSPRQTLLLKLPRWSAIPAAIVLAVALHPVVNALQRAVISLYPISEQVQKAAQGLQVLTAAPFWQLLLLIAVTPAICEELAFRGFILSGFRHLGHRGQAIAYSAIFFGLTHGILQQSLIACLVGVVIGIVAVQSGSILPGVLFHLIHNSLGLAATRISPQRLDDWLQTWFHANSHTGFWRGVVQTCVSFDPEGGMIYRWPLVVVSGLISLAILMWFAWLRAPKSAEEELQEAIQRADSSATQPQAIADAEL